METSRFRCYAKGVTSLAHGLRNRVEQANGADECVATTHYVQHIIRKIAQEVGILSGQIPRTRKARMNTRRNGVRAGTRGDKRVNTTKRAVMDGPHQVHGRLHVSGHMTGDRPNHRELMKDHWVNMSHLRDIDMSKAKEKANLSLHRLHQ